MSANTLIRCRCGAALRPPEVAAPSVRCPICAEVIRLEPVAAEPVEGPHIRQTPVEPDDEITIAEEVLDTPPGGSPLPSEPSASMAARLLEPMPRRRRDPLLIWSIAGAAATLSAVIAYLLGHASGLDDAFAELGRPSGVVTASAPAQEDQGEANTTERELFRLCRALEESRPDFDDPLQESTEAGRRALEAWAARWRKGWDGPLGKVATELDLTFDWTCHVQGYELGKGFDCTTGPAGGTAFRLNVFGLGARFYKGIEELHAGDTLRLQGALPALREDSGTRLQVGTRCEVALVTDRTDLVHIDRAR